MHANFGVLEIVVMIASLLFSTAHFISQLYRLSLTVQ